MRIFDLAGIEFGRVDFTVIDGKIAVFEINTNPTFPRFVGGSPEREERRAGILQQLRSAFEEIDTGPARGVIRFCPDRKTIRYAKQKRWSFLERQLWKLRYLGLRPKEGDHEDH